MMGTMHPDDVLAFWFGQERQAWFRKDPVFDDAIRQRFLGTCEAAAESRLADWRRTARGCLALILVLDQFPRNLFRGQARAFATDPQAREVTRHVLEQGWDRSMTPTERMFLYLPLEHSESLSDQEQCLALMTQISGAPETADLPQWARAHLEIIRRFGRFPHRNAALGRETTPEEAEFLKGPGSSF